MKTHTVPRFLSGLLSGGLILAALGTSPAGAAPLTVNTLADTVVAGDGACSLREAMNNANTASETTGGDCAAGTGVDTITFSVSGTITLGSTLPAIASTLTINGTGQSVTVSGNNAVQVMTVNAGATLHLVHLTVANGRTSVTSGGGIFNAGTLTITNSTFSGNRVDAPLAILNSGGGISNSGTLTVSNSTFSGNSAIGNSFGGGISNSGTLTVSNSTFSGNSTNRVGGGISNSGTLTVSNSTFSINSAPPSGGDSISNSGTLTLANTILANSLRGADCENFGTLLPVGVNLVADGSCGASADAVHFLTGDPLLDPLADNGGPTQTHALLAVSPAIDAADNALCAADPVNNLDQRGEPRPQDGDGDGAADCDIGAYEVQPPPDTTAPVITLTTPANGATYLLHQVVLADYTCTDEAGGSGLTTCDGTVADGEAIDTATVGTHTFLVDAEDTAGNVASALATYDVLYDFSGFLAPVDNPPVLNVAKAGSAIPVQFSLAGDQGLEIFGSAPSSQAIACDTTAPQDLVTETVTAGNSSLTYDLTTDTYTYVWKTDKSWSGCWQLTLSLNDGTSHTALFKFTK